MSIPNNTAAVAAGFKALASAQINHERATGRIVVKLIQEGVGTADISKGGRYLAAFMEGVASAVLTEKQLKVWDDTSLATRAGGQHTERGQLMTRVSSRASKVRAAFKALAEEPADRGARGQNSSPTQTFFKVIDKYVERFAKEDASDKFDFDPKLARQRLVALVKELK